MVSSSWGSQDNISNLVALVWPNQSRVMTTFSALVKYWTLYSGPSVGFIPFDLNQLLDIGVDQWLEICIVNTCQWVYVMAKGLFLLAGRLFHFPKCHNGLVSSRNEHRCISHSKTRGGSGWKLEGLRCFHPSIACKQDIESEYTTRLLQSDRCGLSSKAAVIWETLNRWRMVIKPFWKSLHWRHNERGDVSDHQPYDCLLNRFFQAQINKNIKAPRHKPLYGEFTGNRWIPCAKGQ